MQLQARVPKHERGIHDEKDPLDRRGAEFVRGAQPDR